MNTPRIKFGNAIEAFLWLAALGVLVENISLVRQNRSLQEAVAPQIAAQLPNLPAPPFPFAGASFAHFNGAGSFFGDAKVNAGGVILDVPVTGIYTVNSDCTGTITVNTSLGLTLHNAMVVIGGGQRFILTETDPFAVVQRRAERLGD